MIILISGPSAVGKNTIWLPAAKQLDLNIIVPYTTRPIRLGEKEGYDYNFITKLEFKEKIKKGFFFEWDYFHENYYGSSNISLTEATSGRYIVHSLSRMAIRIKNRLRNEPKTIFLMPCNMQNIRDRWVERNWSPEDLAYRDMGVREELEHSILFDYIIRNAENMDLDQASKELDKIIKT